jgi:ABC-type oligopeptide transport system ATPase subunit
MNRDPAPLIKVKNLKKHFLINKKIFKAVDNISFEIQKSKTLALVGESGSGKTTIGKTILRLLSPTSGDIFFENENILKIKKFKKYRKKMQIIFQDPYASLNPRMTVKEIIEEPLKIHKIKNKKRAEQLLDLVKMPKFFLKKFPHEFSGGQRQRIGIARALCLNPKFLVLDEPVSALDLSIQAQIINLLKELQEELHLTYLFISHDLAVVRHIATEVAVIYLGQIVEYIPNYF